MSRRGKERLMPFCFKDMPKRSEFWCHWSETKYGASIPWLERAARTDSRDSDFIVLAKIQ